MGTLYVVATPIGNMEDLSPRARRILSEVSLIAAEDTRHTGMMLKRLGIDTPLLSNHGFNERARVQQLMIVLGDGDVALVSDSGTPAVSDPGAILVSAAADAGFPVVPVPGPSAVVAAVSASGLIDSSFTFLGFLPRGGNQRRDALAQGLATGIPLVLYESGPRIAELIETLSEQAPDRSVVIFRELTKLHEEAFRGTARSLSDRRNAMSRKGEFVVVVGQGSAESAVDTDALIDIGIDRGERATDIARNVARSTGEPRSDVYARVLERLRSRTGDQGA